MTTTDKLSVMSDDDLVWHAELIEKAGWHPNHSQNELARALRELLAHRRASQAAPAPTDEQLKVWADHVIAGGRATQATPVAWRSEDRSHPGWYYYGDAAQEPKPDDAQMLYTAPAPSDGLREAWIAGRDAAAAEAFYACGCKDSIEALTPPAQEVKP